MDISALKEVGVCVNVQKCASIWSYADYSAVNSVVI